MLVALLVITTVGSSSLLEGGCDCMQKPRKEQQLCLNALVAMTQRGTGGTAVAVVCSTSNQACINAAVVAQLTAFKMSCSQGAAYQACLNNAICTQYRFAKESFK